MSGRMAVSAADRCTLGATGRLGLTGVNGSWWIRRPHFQDLLQSHGAYRESLLDPCRSGLAGPDHDDAHSSICSSRRHGWLLSDMKYRQAPRRHQLVVGPTARQPLANDDPTHAVAGLDAAWRAWKTSVQAGAFAGKAQQRRRRRAALQGPGRASFDDGRRPGSCFGGHYPPLFRSSSTCSKARLPS